MLNDLIIFVFSLWGVISILFAFVFKMILWRTEKFTFTLPLSDGDKEILNKVYNIRSFCEFCGIEKKSTVILVNYDAPEWFCNEISRFYEKYNFVKIVSPDELKYTIREQRT